jgi:hypothetical protein
MSFHLRVVMPSHPRFLAIVRAAVGELGLVYGMPEESCRELILAVDEAVAINSFMSLISVSRLSSGRGGAEWRWVGFSAGRVRRGACDRQVACINRNTAMIIYDRRLIQPLLAAQLVEEPGHRLLFPLRVES